MEQNDPFPTDRVLRHIPNIITLEDISLTTSSIVGQSQPEQPKNVEPEKPQSWLTYFKEKFDKLSSKMRTIWKDDNKAQALENNIHFFKAPKRKDSWPKNTTAIDKNAPNLNQERNKISNNKPKQQKKASLINVLDYYRTVFVDKAKSKIELEGPLFSLPDMEDKIHPVPQNTQYNYYPHYLQPPVKNMEIEEDETKKIEETVNIQKQEKKNRCPPNVKVYMLGKRMISKPSFSKKNKLKNTIAKTENTAPKKIKESLRIGTYLQNIDSNEDNEEFDDNNFARPTKKIFNNDRMGLKSETILLGLPDFHSKLKQNCFEKEAIEKEINSDYQYEKPNKKVIEGEDFGRRRRFEVPKNDLFSIKEEILPKKFDSESDMNTKNLFSFEPSQNKELSAPSSSFPSLIVPKTFNWENKLLKPKDNNYNRNELNLHKETKVNSFPLTKFNSEESSGYIFESETKEIKVKEIFPQTDYLSDSTSFSSKSKDNQEPGTGNNNNNSKNAFPQFHSEFKIPRFFRE